LLYRAVAEGFGLAEALALTYQGLIEEQVADWCLLRLYAQHGAWGELVLPPGDVVRQQLPEAMLGMGWCRWRGRMILWGGDVICSVVCRR
jgi:hypothetical protein